MTDVNKESSIGLALLMALGALASTDCGDPECPVHGKDAKAPEAPKDKEGRERYNAGGLIQFLEVPTVDMAIAIGVRIGRFIERWKSAAAPNEKRAFKIEGNNLNPLEYNVMLQSTDRNAVNAAALELGDELSDFGKLISR